MVSTEKFSDQFHAQWKDVKTVLRISRIRKTRDRRYVIQNPKTDGKTTYTVNQKEGTWRTTTETVYYVSSKKLTAKRGLNATRNH
jgi:hypothetical protein